MKADIRKAIEAGLESGKIEGVDKNTITRHNWRVRYVRLIRELVRDLALDNPRLSYGTAQRALNEVSGSSRKVNSNKPLF